MLMQENIEILEKTICNILDNQKKIYNDVEKIKKDNLFYDDIKNLESYNDLVTCDYTDGVYKKEKNEIMKSKDFTLYTVIKQYNEKIYKHIEIVYESSDKVTKVDNYKNCTKEEFDNLWKN